MWRKTQWRPTAVRRIGTPQLRREKDVRADLGKMKIKNWNKMAMDREAWKRNAQHAKIHKELQHQVKKNSFQYLPKCTTTLT